MDDFTRISIDPVKLREARVSAGYTQEAAGKAVGVIKQTIGNIEGGLALPSANILARLCALYGVELSALTYEAEAA
jgi:DNA-binding XRE family transcriptional regulator